MTHVHTPCLNEVIILALIKQAHKPADLDLAIRALRRTSHFFPEEADTLWQAFDEKARSFGEAGDSRREYFNIVLFDGKTRSYP